ncbi:MAG: type II toxin-antitoxin system HicB family antitoxin [Christensenellales bacterium]|jgi:predicted RNase H-like HicB family nuclease
MFHYVYPAVFYNHENEYQVLIPDINLTTSGATLDEAYLLAKDFLRAYFTYALKFDIATELPSSYVALFEKCKNQENTYVMLIDALVAKPKD